ncbi:3-isopropylmalate dehydrogenase [Silanimonas sp.]|uniref:3-isopropylmalate dehydrogenase n=1 Tax=Silanimonas sp. TaxID=1929290 RepID=UPI0022CAA613|nr:3-isopropylmalate dehydrogenase [Silanimonas sp.]MCZ8165630.1 3-isopropylmalate dehydrogenase [Silanimonas sp.]
MPREIRITVLPGDGIGPEVTAAAVAVLQAVGQRFGQTFRIEEALIGGAAIDATGQALPPATAEACDRADAVLLGAVGGPKWSDPKAPVRPEQGLLALRKQLNVYANLRPVKPHPATLKHSAIKAEVLQGVDLVVVRELTGGSYFGRKERHADRAVDVCEYTVEEIERVARHAFRLARTRRGKVTSVDKANVLETSRLWRETVTRVHRAEFPDVVLEHQLVDSMAMHLISRPRDYDVVVTENLFGDILTDEAAMLAGSMGLLPSAALGDGPRGLYEPIHGSAPDIAGQGIANPIAAILSVAMLLRHSLSLHREADAVESAVGAVLDAGEGNVALRARDLGGTANTAALTSAVLSALAADAPQANAAEHAFPAVELRD